MDETRFWEIIDSVKGDDRDDDHAERLVDLLMSLSPDDIVHFDVWFQTFHVRAYRGDVWAAGVLLNSGHGTDDGFEYFRNWLISRGRATYEQALVDVDALASQAVEMTDDGPSAEFERFGYATVEAYEALTGNDIYDALDAFESGDEDDGPDGEDSFNSVSEDDDDLAVRLPRLWAMYGRFKQRSDDAMVSLGDELEVKPDEVVDIEGLGALSIGQCLHHQHHGPGRIVSMVRLDGGIVMANIAFADDEKPMLVNANPALWRI